jgi:hypothetical protein
VTWLIARPEVSQAEEPGALLQDYQFALLPRMANCAMPSS